MSFAHIVGLMFGRHVRQPRTRTQAPATRHYVTLARSVTCQEIATLAAEASAPELASKLAIARASVSAPRPSVLRVQSRGDWLPIACEPIAPKLARRFPCTLGDLHKVKRDQPRPFAIVAYVNQAAFCFGFTNDAAEAAAQCQAVTDQFPGAIMVMTCDARLRVQGDMQTFERCVAQGLPNDPDFVYHEPI